MNSFPRITVDADQMGGVPSIHSLRIPVATILRMLAGGITESNILTEYRTLRSRTYEAASAMERELPPLRA